MEQCNSCGAVRDDVWKCRFCTTLICNSCRINHESVCETTSRLKGSRSGATVRNVPEAKPQDQEKATEPELPTTEQVAAIQKAIQEMEANGEQFFSMPLVEDGVYRGEADIRTLADAITGAQPKSLIEKLPVTKILVDPAERPTTMPPVLGAPYLPENAVPPSTDPYQELAGALNDQSDDNTAGTDADASGLRGDADPREAEGSGDSSEGAATV